MVAAPTATPVTKPVGATVASAGVLDVQLTDRPESTLPAESRSVAVSGSVAPTATLAAAVHVRVFLFLMKRRPPRPTLFPYATLFRSVVVVAGAGEGDGERRRAALAFARRRDRRRPAGHARRQPAAAHRGGGGVAARPRHRPPGERVPSRVLGHGGQLCRAAH